MHFSPIYFGQSGEKSGNGGTDAVMAYFMLVISIALSAAVGALCGRRYSVFALVPASLLVAGSIVALKAGLAPGPGAPLLWVLWGLLALQFGFLAALAVSRPKRRTRNVSDRLEDILRADFAVPPRRHRDDRPKKARALEPGRLDVGD